MDDISQTKKTPVHLPHEKPPEHPGKIVANKVPNTDVFSRAGLPSMFTLVRQRRLHWLGYVHRMPDGRIPKYLRYVEVATGSKRTGRPQLRYREAVKRDVKAVGIAIETWENLVADWSRWRGTVTKHLKRGMEKLRRVAT